MGKIASELADKVIVTSDNPRTEEPLAIIEDIKVGITKDNYEVIPDREEAIKYSIINSENNVIILIAGKGHEDYQIIGTQKIHFSDYETAKKYLEKL